MSKYVSAVKAGKLRNGFAKDQGSIIHSVEILGRYIDGQLNPALCGERFKIRSPVGWVSPYPEDKAVTCPKCIKRLTDADAIAEINKVVE